MRSIEDVAARKMCTGCGVCAYMAPESYRMVDVLAEGRRPLPIRPVDRGPGPEAPGRAPREADALRACPGVGLTAVADDRPQLDGWGPVLGMWEGYAAPESLRYAASSGGAATALAGFCLEHRGFGGVLHTGARADIPYLNEVKFSRTQAELLEHVGSRYAPASPAEGLGLVEDADAPSVFIGKPCDVAASHKARALRPGLDAKLGLTIAIFCAGTPSTRGTLELIKALGSDPEQLKSLHYRGEGWPGEARAEPGERQLSYDASWGGILEKHRQWRCYLCADHTGEFADVSVGDPWHRPTAGDPGRSLIVARTARGVEIVLAAIAAGVLVAEAVPYDRLPASQAGLLKVRGAVWGRTVALRLSGLPAPRYRGLPMFGIWLRKLTVKDKLRSTVGTVRRIGRRGLRQRSVVEEYRP
ncbi:coenzyme F420-reducing hydrogenase subunit beta-like protein [Longispora fulva]|uniref:Coenzyme F420 hydrogenase subunit beta n=1 Tax=Longispora fulva TaxID=619741 RepID=A0A8J7GPA4_9ACTN|nr:Coenzyme F420 hydrogenase/dehydrogenase, beta subunit C-terminal domain [Longispora fulva]MBG6140887.1 coenzyme F420 hydrogenase subunit beta [Longispora fulva]GIG60847.1 coenzyme F420-reducing hydrogenase subunit beta-like protein [Longispora fulva]